MEPTIVNPTLPTSNEPPAPNEIANPNPPSILNTPPPNVDWSAHVPKGSEKVFESFKGKPLSDILTSHVEAQKLIGGSIRLPKADAKPEEVTKFKEDIYNKLGRPETADKYDLGELPLVSESFKWDDAKLSVAKTELHKAGLTNDQVKAVIGIYANDLKTFFPDPVQAAADSKQKLVDEYGSEQLYERNLAFAQKPVKAYGDAEFMTWLDSTGMGSQPPFVKFMAKIGRELSEHGAVDASTADFGMSQADAQKAIDKVQNDKTDIYWAKPGTPGKADRQKEVDSWYKIVAGEA